jgi:endonuclease/exonuclease/phosphatase family metal-dependent hydrolase
MRVVTYNIRFAWGLDGRVDLERIAESVRDADIIALQEVERFWRRSGMSDQPAELARLLDGYYWVYGPAFDVDASERGPNGEIANRRRQFGTMVLARWPILASRLLVLPKCATVHHFNMDLGALECVIDTTLGPLRVYSLHLSSLSAPERLVQIERLLDRHREAAASGGPWTGDFKIQDDRPPPGRLQQRAGLGRVRAHRRPRRPGHGPRRLQRRLRRQLERGQR